MHLFHARLAKRNLAGKVRAVRLHGRQYICALGGWRASKACQHGLPEPCSSVSHRQGRTPLAIFGIHHIGPSILHMLVKCWNLRLLNFGRVLVLRKHRHNGNTCMATNHRHLNVLRVLPRDLCHKLVGSHTVQCGDTYNFLRVQPFLLVQLGHSGHNRIDWVDDQRNYSIWTVLRASFNHLFGDARIDFEEIIPRHSRLPGHAGWYQNK
mmetsp:Transcript_28575/g.53587  ORF Transcript_28575/g.53587 Transcript_28575/m.53587 type:complete len:209 (-) Transcript_28575:485-1111(-)